MKEILIKLVLIFGLAFLLLLVIDRAYRIQYQLSYQFPQNLFANPPIEDKYRLVKVGNSHTQSGITFKKYDIKSLDLSSAAQRFETDLALLKQHQNQIADNAVIIINVSPISFSHTNYNSSKGFQAGYYGRVSPFYIPHLNWGDYFESEFMPFARSAYFWRQKYATEVRDRLSFQEKIEFEKNKTQPSPSPTPISASAHSITPSNQQGSEQKLNVEVSELQYNVEYIQQNLLRTATGENKFGENVHFIFNKWYHTDEFSPDFFNINIRDLEKLIAFCKKNNWRPVLITIPITKELEKGLLDDYKQVYLYDNLAKSDLQGTSYIDFSNDEHLSTKNFWFSNADHLNDEGAAAFSYVLLRALIDQDYLPNEIDRYDYRPLYVGP